MTKLVKYTLLVTIIALLSACDSESKFKDLDQAIKRNKLNISSIVVEPTKNITIECAADPCDTTFLSTSKSETFVARGFTPDGQPIDISGDVIWSTSDSAKAQINQNGILTTQTSLGDVDVIASFASIEGRARVTVSSAMLADDMFIFRDNQGTDITSPQQVTMCDTFEMQVVGDFGDSKRIITHDIGWSTRLASAPTEDTLNAKVATNESIFAVFSSHTPETYAVHASYQNNPNSTVSSIFNFDVVAVIFGTSITVTPSSPQTVTKDTTFQYRASASINSFSTDITNTAKWEPIPGTGSVEVKDGLVKGIAVGTATITASCGTTVSLPASVTVDVNPTLVAIDIQDTNQTTLSVLNLELLPPDNNNKVKDVIIMATYTDQSDKDITADITQWVIDASDGNNVTPPISVAVSVDDTLRVTALRLGTASLTVKFSGREDSITVNVR